MSVRRLETPELDRPVSITGPAEVMLPGGDGAVTADLRCNAAADRPVTIHGFQDLAKPAFSRPLLGGSDPLVVTTRTTVVLDLLPTGWQVRT